eukprot:SAG22_NODE_1308_length_4787_cov_3.561860_7_plen_60_part_00
MTQAAANAGRRVVKITDFGLARSKAYIGEATAVMTQVNSEEEVHVSMPPLITPPIVDFF